MKQKNGVRGLIFWVWGVLFTCVLSAENTLAENASTPGVYDIPGFNPTREYGIDGFDSVDPATGALKLLHTDLVLPLNGEVDIKIQRNYQLHQRVDDVSLWYYNDQEDGRGVVGANWDLHLGRIWPAVGNIPASNTNSCQGLPGTDSSNRHVLELPDGTKQTLYKAQATDTVNAFVTSQRWVARCLPTSANASGDGGLVVYSPEGMKYTFNKFGYAKSMQRQAYVVTKIEDRNGNSVVVNYINSSNAATSTLLISSVDPSESGAPTINFSYEDSSGKVSTPFNLDVQLDKITVGDRTVSYAYQEVMQPNGSSYGSSTVPRQYKLTDVTLADSTKWAYTYYPTSNETLLSAPINTVTSPLFGVHTYSYVLQTVSALTTTDKRRIVTSSRALAGLGTWSYEYLFSGEFDSDDTTTVSGPTDCVKYQHRVLSTQLWDSGTLTKKTIYEPNCSTQVQVDSYTWEGEIISPDIQVSQRPKLTAGSTKLPRLTNLAITRDSTTYTRALSNYDSYGNPRHVESWQSNLGAADKKTVDYTYDVKPDKWILHLLDTENYAGIGSATDVDRVYDANGNLTSETSFGKAKTYTYLSGEVNKKTEPEAALTTYSSYKAGVPQSVVPPAGPSISRVVDNFGNITTETYAAITAPSGHSADVAVTVSYAFDKANRLTSVSTPRTDDANIGLAYTFSSSANTRVIIRGASKTTETYDKFGRKTAVKNEDTANAVAITSKFDFDAANRITAEYYPSENTTFAKSRQYSFDALGRVKTVTNSADASTITSVYQANNKVLVTDEDLRATTYTYRSFDDPDGKQLMSVVAPESQTTAITRNILGFVTSVTQGGVAHNYSYNAKMLLESESRPEIGQIDYTRDDRGNMLSRKVTFGGVASGTTSFSYNGLNQLTNINYPGSAPDVTITYNKFGAPWQVKKGLSTWDYTYDGNNNLLSEKLALATTPAKTFLLGHSYDTLDNEKTVTYPSGKPISITRDALGRVTDMAQSGSGNIGDLLTDAKYFPSGNLKSYRYGNGQIMTLTETPRRWPESYVTSGAGIASFKYDYTKVGDVSKITDNARASRTRSFTYDGLHRLKSAVGSGSWGNAAISYNSRGDILSKSDGSGTGLNFTYDTASFRLSSVSGSGVWSYAYDVYGNVSGKTGKTFVYDDASNMTSSGTQSYLYDGHNRRYWQRAADGKETFSVYSLAGQLVHQEEVQDKVPKDYIYLGNQLITRVDYCENTLDADGDGMNTCWERKQGLNENVNDASSDKDGDGLTNYQEYIMGTTANNPDTDRDGMPDGYEAANGLNPKVASDANTDLDGDTITNYLEYVAGTDPQSSDTDSDGIPDNLDSAPLFNVAAFIPVLYLLMN